MLLGYTLARLARKIPTGAGSRSTPQPSLQVLNNRSHRSPAAWLLPAGPGGCPRDGTSRRGRFGNGPDGLGPPDLALGRHGYHGSFSTRARVASSRPPSSSASWGAAGTPERRPGPSPIDADARPGLRGRAGRRRNETATPWLTRASTSARRRASTRVTSCAMPVPRASVARSTSWPAHLGGHEHPRRTTSFLAPHLPSPTVPKRLGERAPGRG